MIDHLKDGCVTKSNVLLLEWRHRIVANVVQDEFLARLYDAQVVPVALLFDIVLLHELLACCGCIACCKGVDRVCAWIERYREGSGGVADDEPVLAVLLSLFAVMGLRHGEYSTELVFELVDGLRRDHAVEACQLVMEGDECIIRIVQC